MLWESNYLRKATKNHCSNDGLLIQRGNFIEKNVIFILCFYICHALEVSQWVLIACLLSVGNCASLDARPSSEQQNQ